MAFSYMNFMKHAQKVTKTASKSRPMLKGVYHAPDGSLFVTDSYRLYVARNAHANGSESIVNPKTGEKIEGNFPNCERLLPDPTNALFTLKLPTKKSLDAFNALFKAGQVEGKGHDAVSVQEGEKNQVIFKAKNQTMEATYNAGEAVGQIGELTFDATFVIDALKMFHDAGFLKVEMRYYNEYRPFTLSAGLNDELLALITPIRVK